MGIPDLTCLLRNLYAGQEPTVRTRHETMNWFKLGMEYMKAVYCHPAYFTSMQSTSWEMSGRMNHKLESRFLGEVSAASDMQMITTLMAESKEELKSLLMKVKEESEKTSLKLNIKKSKTMASGPITSWQIGKNWKEWQISFSLAPKSLGDSDYSCEIKKCLLLGRKAMKNLDSILKAYIILPTKVPYSQSYGFSNSYVQMWELDHEG